MLNLPAHRSARESVTPAVVLVSLLCFFSSLNLTASGHNRIITEQMSQDGLPSLVAMAKHTRSDGLVQNIRFTPDVSEDQRNRIISESNGTLVGWIAPLQIASVQWSLEKLPEARSIDSGSSSLSLRQSLVSSESLQFVEDDAIVSGTYVPNDPELSDQNLAYNYHRLDIFAAWAIEQGNQDVVVAIIDTGVSPHHPEFMGRLISGYDFVNNDAEPDDDHGHGTHVAGIIAGAADNEYGVAGLCPNCSLLSVKVLDSGNVGTWFTAAQGLVYAVDSGADIINLSLGAATPSSTIKAAIDYAESKGVLVVAAAGNAGGSAPFYPAAYDSVFSVGATTDEDTLWIMSNRGATIDVTAPGEFIYNAHPDLENSYGGFTYKSGTSMASPHVAGLAGLLLSQDQTRDTDELKHIIRSTTDDLGDGGWDETFGYGRINAASSLLYGESLMSGLAEPLVTRNQSVELYLPAITGP